MSNYSQTTFFTPKDSLPTGDPDKIILGAEVDPEFSAISTAIATKYDSAWSAGGGGLIDDIVALTNPGADRVLFWDNSGPGVGYLTVSTGLDLTGTALTLDINGLTTQTGLDATLDFLPMWDASLGALRKVNIDDLVGASSTGVPITRNLIAGSGLTGGGDLSADRTFNVGAGTGITVAADTVGLDTASTRNTDHAAVSISPGTGLSGGGTIAANRTLSLSHLGLEALTAPVGDRIAFYDLSGGAFNWLVASTGLSLSGTNLTTNDAQIVHDNLSGFVANEHIDHSTITLTAGVGLSGGGTIAANRTFSLDLNELTASTETDAIDLDADFIAGVDTSASAHRKFYAANLLTPQVGTTVSTTTDTLDEGDFGKLTQYSNTGTVTITLPNGLKTGFWAVLQKTGATGTVNLSATTTLNTVSSLTSITEQYGAVTVFHLGSNVWTAWGNLT